MNFKIIIPIFLFTLVFLGFSASVFATQDNNVSSVCLYYFYGKECPFCNKLADVKFFENLQKEIPSIDLKKFEVFHDRQNASLMNKFFNKYNVLDQDMAVPVVFIGDTYFSGFNSITNDLKNYILEKNPTECPSPEISQQTSQKKFSIITVIGAAVVDSINPCAIAVILILLSALLAGEDRKKLIKVGISFILAVFISYFIFGIGIFSDKNFRSFAFYI
jgi:glutaredoxin